MGTFSKLNRYREAGEGVNVNNAEYYGAPVRSLFTTTKILTLHHHIDVTDDAENIVYQSNSKAISLHDKTVVTDAAGKTVCYIERKVLSIHARHKVVMANGKNFDLSSELLHIVKEVTDIDELGWKLKGNILELNFELCDANDDIIAVVSQKMISMHDKYCIDIYKPEYEQYAVAILITLQHMIADRRAAASSGSSNG